MSCQVRKLITTLVASFRKPRYYSVLVHKSSGGSFLVKERGYNIARIVGGGVEEGSDKSKNQMEEDLPEVLDE